MEPSNSAPSSANTSGETYYGWWIVLAAFLNLFLVVGVIFYGFPAFYPRSEEHTSELQSQ